MIVLPIVGRELRVLSRERKNFRARLTVAIISVIFGGGAIIIYNLFGGGIAGFGLLGGIGSFLLAFCIISGAQSTFDCLSEEKRSGTLGLLFLTDLKGYDIVLGKLAVTSLNSFFGLLAVVPVLAILIPLGRVQADEFFRMALALINTLFLSHAIGLFVSTISRKRQWAAAGVFGMILLFWLGLPGIAELLRELGFDPRIYAPLELLSPSKTYAWAASATYGLRSNYYWISLLCTHLLALSFLGSASLILPRVWQDKAFGPRGLRWRERFKQWCYGRVEVRTAYRRRLIHKNPFYWLTARDRLKPLWVWGFLVSLLTVVSIIAFVDSGAANEIGLPIAFTVIATLVLKLWVASEASRAWTEERLQGTLELLFCPPVSASEIVKGHQAALRRQFTGPIIIVALAQIAVVFLGYREEIVKGTDQVLWVMGGFLYTLTMFLDFWALSWLGIWSGLTAKNVRTANQLPLGRVLALPSMIWYSIFVVQLIPVIMGSSSQPPVMFNWCLWFGLGIATSLFWGIVARRRLLTGVREAVATLAAGEKPRLFKRPLFAFRSQVASPPVVSASTTC
jgi:hypothetical protein